MEYGNPKECSLTSLWKFSSTARSQKEKLEWKRAIIDLEGIGTLETVDHSDIIGDIARKLLERSREQ